MPLMHQNWAVAVVCLGWIALAVPAWSQAPVNADHAPDKKTTPTPSAPQQPVAPAPSGDANNPQSNLQNKQDKQKDKLQNDQRANPSGCPGAGRVMPIQIAYAPTDIVWNDTTGGSETLLSARSGPIQLNAGCLQIAGGELADKDSGARLPTQAFQLKADSSQLVRITLQDNWIKTGNFSGSLWVAYTDGQGGVAVPLKVFVRRWWVWVVGPVVIAAGAFLSWFSVTYVVRQRQVTANEVLIARLAELLSALKSTLQGVSDAGAPIPKLTLEHIKELQTSRRNELFDDSELMAMAGITVPPTGQMTVVDEIESVTRVVRNGFVPLLAIWKAASGPAQVALQGQFGSMDGLGGTPHGLDTIDAAILAIVTAAPPAPALAAMGFVAAVRPAAPPPLPSERVLLHRVVRSTQWLDLLSGLTVVLLGVYVLIWKDAGYGSFGDYLMAFLWGLGLKMGGDVTKLAPTDVRTAFGIKVPSP
jgi:hypothetical protein